MKNIAKVIGYIVALGIALAVMTIAYIYNEQVRQKSAGHPLQTLSVNSTPQPCAPTPHAPTFFGTNSPTPKRGQVITPAPDVSATPLFQVSKTTDLAPELKTKIRSMYM